MSVRTVDPSRTKDQLIQAAVRVFSQKGFQKTRVSDIVGEAGVAQGTFYLYFQSKEEIFRLIQTNHKDHFVKVFEETDHLFAGKDHREIKNNIQSFLAKLLEVYRKNIQISELLFREGIGHGGLFRDIHEDFLKCFVGLLQKQMKRDIPGERFPFEDSEMLAIFLIGIFLQASSYRMIKKKKFNSDHLADLMSEFMLKGLQL